jgi:hypothetical protein
MSGHARPDMHGNSCDLVAVDFALACVKAAPDRESQGSHDFSHRTGAPYRARWALEAGEHPIPGGVDYPPSQARNLLANLLLIGVHQVPPPCIAKCSSALGGADHVDEQDRSENTIYLGGRAYAGHELLNLGKQRIDLAGPCHVVDARKFDVFGAWDLASHVPGASRIHEPIADPVNDERGDSNCRKDRTDVDLDIHPVQGHPSPGTRRQALLSAPPLAPPLVACDAWCQDLEADGSTPMLFIRLEGCFMVLPRRRPRIFGVANPFGVRAVHYQRRRPHWICRGKQRR